MALPCHLFRGYRWRSTALICICSLFISSIDSMKVTIEKSRVFNTTAGCDSFGMQAFKELKMATYTNYETNFGNSSYKGIYSDLRFMSGTGLGVESKHYPFATPQHPYVLKITQVPPPGLNYFGLFVYRLHSSNVLEIRNKGNPIFVLNAQDIINHLEREKWFGKPDLDRFVNFFVNQLYDEIRFLSQDVYHPFGSDLHSVGNCTEKSGEEVTLPMATTPTPPETTTTLPETTTTTLPEPPAQAPPENIPSPELPAQAPPDGIPSPEPPAQAPPEPPAQAPPEGIPPPEPPAQARPQLITPKLLTATTTHIPTISTAAEKKVNVPMIVGGVVGGVLAVIGLMGGGIFASKYLGGKRETSLSFDTFGEKQKDVSEREIRISDAGVEYA